MAELKKEDILKQEILTVSEWAGKYGEGMSNNAVGYLMEAGHLDFVRIGRDRFIVLTQKSLTYTPTRSDLRGEGTATMRTGK